MAEPFDQSLVARLIGEPVTAMEPVRGGGNNRLFRIETAGGRRYALKHYFTSSGDTRDRFGVETGALTFLNRLAVDGVPRLIARDVGSRLALFDWIKGSPIQYPGPVEIDAALALVARLRTLGSAAEAGELPAASDACFSGRDLLEQIERRRGRLDPVLAENPALERLMHDVFDPLLMKFQRRAETMYEQTGLTMAATLPREARLLSPSDFGFHNALRLAEGGVVFVDFEYFGWDDPVKLLSDMLWHPGMTLGAAERARLTGGFKRLFAGSYHFSARFEVLFPLFGLCWSLIVLNEFLPKVWARRHGAGETDAWATAKGRQLEKARRLLELLE